MAEDVLPPEQVKKTEAVDVDALVNSIQEPEAQTDEDAVATAQTDM